MDILNEKLFFHKEEFSEIQDILLKKKICFLEEQIEYLKRKCVELFHHYDRQKIKDYDQVLTEAKACWLEIWNENWSEHIQFLNIFKVKACLFLGTIYVCSLDYDIALKYLTSAKNLIEKESAQYIIPEFYVSVCIEMSKCYIDKHTPIKIAKDCLIKANVVWEKSREDICKNYSVFYFNRLLLELKLQQAFTEIDQYSGDDGEENEKKALELLDEVKNLLSQTENDHDSLPGGFFYEKWKEKQDATLRTTRGECLKNLYFQLKEKEKFSRDENWKVEEKTIEEIRQVLEILLKETLEIDQVSAEDFTVTFQELQAIKEKFHTFPEEPENFDSGKRDILKESIQKLRLCCLEVTVFIFSNVLTRYSDNTICLNDMAALFYDYGGEKSIEEQEKADRDKILRRLIGMRCRNYERDTVRETIEAILDKVLEMERTNMFALNIKAALSKELRIPRKMADYPALRQSSLKRWFVRMEKACLKDRKGQMPREFEDIFLKIEMCLITLYGQMVRFMNAAVIDCNSKEWENLTVGHYTRMQVLPKLIDKEAGARLRIRNVHHLNDIKEGAFLINRVKKRISTEKNNLLMEELWNLYNSDSVGAVRNSVYMGSFTSRLDQLNMWEKYGDGGKGVSIQFKAGDYFDSEANVSLSQIATSGSYGHYKIENIKYPLYMVIYLPDQEDGNLMKAAEYAGERAEAEENRIKINREDEKNGKGEENKGEIENGKNKDSKEYLSLEAKWWGKQRELIKRLSILEEEITESLKKIQEHFLDLNVHLVLDVQTQEKLKRELCNTIMVILDLTRFLIKNDYYRDEREYRVIQYSADPECETEGTTVPKLFIPIEKEPVYEKVCFGPLVTDFESKAAYILNIRKNSDEKSEDNWNIEVRKSSIQYKKE